MAADGLESPTVLITANNSVLTRARTNKVLLWFFVAAMITTHAYFLWRVRDRIERGDPDFTVFYTAGEMLREGHGAQLYDPQAQRMVQAEFTRNLDVRSGPLPYIHPPFEGLIFLPLTFLPYALAFTVWNVLNLGMLWVVVVLLRRSLISLQKVPAWQVFLLCLAFFPIFATFHQGQDAMLLLLIATLSFRALDRNSVFLAGCWLGFGVFKYHFIVPLAILLAVWRGRKFVLGFASSGSTAVLISLGLVGWKGAMRYPGYAWQVVSQPLLGGIPARQLPDLFGLIAGWPVSEGRGWLIAFSVVLISVLLLIVVAIRAREAGTVSRRRGFACAVIAALLVGYSTNTYDLSLLILPLAITADLFGRVLRGVMVPIVPLLISPLWFFLWMRWHQTNVMALFLLWWLCAMLLVKNSNLQARAPTPESQISNA